MHWAVVGTISPTATLRAWSSSSGFSTGFVRRVRLVRRRRTRMATRAGRRPAVAASGQMLGSEPAANLMSHG